MPAHARAATGGGGRAAGAGAGAGPGSGSGSLPGLVLFESGITGMGYVKHTRSAIRIRTGPPTDPLDNQQLRLLQLRLLQRFRPNRCNCSVQPSQPSNRPTAANLYGGLLEYEEYICESLN